MTNLDTLISKPQKRADFLFLHIIMESEEQQITKARSFEAYNSTDSEENPEYKFKVLMLGDSGVGKTSLTRRFVQDEFSTSYMHTIGIDFLEKIIEISTNESEKVKVKLQIWDTAGQERFRSLIRPYYRGASGVVLVYDVTDESTFEHLKQWLVSINENISDCQVVHKIIVGNKLDLADEGHRRVNKERGNVLAKGCKCSFMEVSAKDGRGVEEAFAKLAQTVVASLTSTTEFYSGKERINLQQEVSVEPRKKEKKCCLD